MDSMNSYTPRQETAVAECWQVVKIAPPLSLREDIYMEIKP
jgi:hypothetical protein